LQVDGAGDRVGGPGEGGHETVSFALFDGEHPAVAADRVGHDLIQVCDGGGHFPCFCFPEPGGALDVSQQERDRAGGKHKVAFSVRLVGHGRLSPVQRWDQGAGSSFVHEFIIYHLFADNIGVFAYGEAAGRVFRISDFGGRLPSPVAGGW
jgi:hypothetical protein